jgi:hypothetical protein
MFKRIMLVSVAAVFCAGTAWCVTADNEKPAAVDTVKAKMAREVYAQMMARWASNQVFDIEDMEIWSQHILDADLDLATSADERVVAYEEQMKRTSELAKIAKSFARTGQGLESAALAAEYYHLEAVSRSAKGR